MTKDADGLEAAARHMTATVDATAVIDEAVGVLRSWRQCGTVQARQLLHEENNADGVGAEARRLARIINLDAHEETDPDWD